MVHVHIVVVVLLCPFFAKTVASIMTYTCMDSNCCIRASFHHFLKPLDTHNIHKEASKFKINNILDHYTIIIHGSIDSLKSGNDAMILCVSLKMLVRIAYSIENNTLHQDKITWISNLNHWKIWSYAKHYIYQHFACILERTPILQLWYASLHLSLLSPFPHLDNQHEYPFEVLLDPEGMFGPLLFLPLSKVSDSCPLVALLTPLFDALACTGPSPSQCLYINNSLQKSATCFFPFSYMWRLEC